MGTHTDKIVFVSGSTEGIGRATARKFAEEGASVIINDEGSNRGDDMVSKYENVEYIEADMSDENEIRNLFREIEDKFGRLDVLVNNVGGEAREGTIEDTELSTWGYSANITLRSYWLCSKYAMSIIPDGGCIVNNSSVHSRIAVKNRFPYNVFKSGVNMLTRVSAVEQSPEIRVNAVSPGKINTSAENFDDLERWEMTPMNREGHPSEVANVISFLASDESSYINGAIIPVDGGYLAED